MLYEPTENDWKYSHHQSLAVFQRQLFAIWSDALRDEDSPGQRVLYAVRSETGTWARPRLLFQPDIDPDGRLRILTAAGFHAHGGTLVAYAGDYSIDRKSTRLLAPNEHRRQDLGPPPRPPRAGLSQSWAAADRLRPLDYCRQHRFSLHRRPEGLSGWKMTGVYPPSMEPFQDNPSTFWDVGRAHALAEPLRRFPLPNRRRPAACVVPRHRPAEITQRIPLGKPQRRQRRNLEPAVRNRVQQYRRQVPLRAAARRPFLLGGQPRGNGRMPLVLSLSRDGLRFDRHYILGEKHYQRRFEGHAKGANTAIRIA